jgi:nitroimidazol reductase NimA-like FMN-containing flavoprotein (pyridoxamine 5'-phosphate oxidase superfamily)
MTTSDGAWRIGGRSKVRRLAERGAYDRETIEAILDEGLVCHLGFCTDRGPVVVPTGYARVGDTLYVHGAPANFALQTVGGGQQVCLVVTLVDGLVLARSGFHHSFNYRSVVIYGTATEVTDPEEKRTALDAVVEQIVPGRTRDARGANESELRATRVVRISIDEASAKLRAGGPKDDDEDIEIGGIWAGHLPLAVVPGTPVADDHGGEDLPVPGYVAHYRRPSGATSDPL